MAELSYIYRAQARHEQKDAKRQFANGHGGNHKQKQKDAKRQFANGHGWNHEQKQKDAKRQFANGHGEAWRKYR